MNIIHVILSYSYDVDGSLSIANLFILVILHNGMVMVYRPTRLCVEATLIFALGENPLSARQRERQS